MFDLERRDDAGGAIDGVATEVWLGRVGGDAVYDDLEADAAFVAEDRSAHRRLGHDDLVERGAGLAQPFGVAHGPDETAHLLADGADEVHGWGRPFAFLAELVEHFEEHGECGLGVDRAASVDPLAFDPAVEGVVGHVFDANGVEMNVDGNRSIGRAVESGVDVRAPGEHVVERHVGPEIGRAVGHPFGDCRLGTIAGFGAGLERIDARDPDDLLQQRGHVGLGPHRESVGQGRPPVHR